MSTLQSNIGRWADHVVLARQPYASLQREDAPPYGLFIVAFDNSKKRGRGKPAQHYECWGYCFPSTGHVHLDTLDIHVCDFTSMQDMRDHLEDFGRCIVTWQREGKGDE